MSKGSQSAQPFKKHRAKSRKDLSRRLPTIQPSKRLLVICEGDKTEPNYFKSLIRHLGLSTADIEICKNCGSDPVSIVKFGIDKLDIDHDYDMINFVFDKDTHSNFGDALDRINNLKSLRKHRNIAFSAITSNPCFEVWFLMHFQIFAKPCVASGRKSPCDNVIVKLKKQPGFNKYKKGDDSHFNLLYLKLDAAKNNAKNALEQICAAGYSKHNGNPSTLVYKLVIDIEKLAEDQEIRDNLKFKN